MVASTLTRNITPTYSQQVPFYPPSSKALTTGTSNIQQGIAKSGSFYSTVPSGQAGNSIYPFNFVPPVNFQGTSFSFQPPNVANLAAGYQQSLTPRFNALRDSRTSQLRADFDFLRQKEFERLNQRGAIGSGVENQQMGRFNDEFSRQLSGIDSELIAAQQKEAFDLASRQAELQFRTQQAQAENRLNTEIARAETALKSGQLTLAERELYLKRIQQLINARGELIHLTNEYLGTKQVAPESDNDGQGFNFGSVFGSSLDPLTGGGAGGIGGGVSSAASGINSAGNFGKFLGLY